MSAHALTVYESLLASGIDESRARRVVAVIVDEDIREQVSERVVAEFIDGGEHDRFADIADKMDVQFNRVFAKMDRVIERMDRLAERMDSLHRLLVGIFIGVMGIFAVTVVAVVKFVFFGL